MSTYPISINKAPVNLTPLDARSRKLRHMIVKTVQAGNRGHLGSAFSLVEMLRVLYDDVLKYDPRNPRWIGRDRCILSKGHGCLALYAVLADKGFFQESELLQFCRAEGMLGGHPEYGKVPGVEASATASLLELASLSTRGSKRLLIAFSSSSATENQMRVRYGRRPYVQASTNWTGWWCWWTITSSSLTERPTKY
jgi:hypothetical protein